MALVLEFTFPLPNGLHARPASHFVEATNRFKAAIQFGNSRTGRTANARSILALVATDTRNGDPCRLEIEGADEADARTALGAYLNDGFLTCDEPLVVADSVAGDLAIPRSLRATGLRDFHRGRTACRGLALGATVVAGGFNLPPQLSSEAADDPSLELARFGRAKSALLAELTSEVGAAKATEAGVLAAHLAIVNDPTLTDSVERAIGGRLSAGQAIAAAVCEQRNALLTAESAYIRERVLDLEDIAARLWEKLYGTTSAAATVLEKPAIVFAESLTPSQFLALDRKNLRGLVLARGGQTSHAVILARSFGVPTLTGVANAPAVGRSGANAVLDADLGIVVTNPESGVYDYYERQQAKFARIAASTAARADQRASTADGRRLEVGTNIASVEEATAAFAQGAEGIGLFRTELLFSDRNVAPGEEEQAALYTAVVKAAAGRPVIIRTLDIGGDKPVPFLKFPHEENPFLGYRGVRFYAEQATLVKAQLRALLRAATAGPVKILVPMVACVEEARLVRALLKQAREELVVEGVPCGDSVPLGFMLEVPSVAYILDELCAEADFFSLGTNDLAQYFHAADRENAKVAALNNPLQPGFLRLLQHIVSGVKARGRWIGLCGELAENPSALPLLVGLGLDEISLAAPRIAATKMALARLAGASCEEFLRKVAAAASADDVRQLLPSAPVEALPLLTPELVLTDVAATTKEEAIRAVIDELHVAGRTAAPAAIEEAVWRREETYSTGFGDGFALPHCQTDALSANTIAVARLRTPVEWQSMDGKPVDLVILLGVRASEHGKSHMETLARLSRLMMRDEFREAIRAATNAPEVVALLAQASRPLASAK